MAEQSFKILSNYGQTVVKQSSNYCHNHFSLSIVAAQEHTGTMVNRFLQSLDDRLTIV